MKNMIIKIRPLKNDQTVITDISKIHIDCPNGTAIWFLFDVVDTHQSPKSIIYSYENKTIANQIIDLITEKLEQASFNNESFIDLSESKLLQLLNEKDLNNLPKIKNKMKS